MYMRQREEGKNTKRNSKKKNEKPHTHTNPQQTGNHFQNKIIMQCKGLSNRFNRE